MNIQIDFENKIKANFGERGKQWLSVLATRMNHYLMKWQLQLEGPVDNLSYNYVLKVRDREHTPLILKFGMPGVDFTNEIRATKVYKGARFARLYQYDERDGVMLLERLEPGYMLSEVESEEQVIHHYIDIWKALRTPVKTSFPSMKSWFDELQVYLEKYSKDDCLIPHTLVKNAQCYAQELFETTAGEELLHGDLHHYNILYDEERGWCAIDPKGVIGDSYFDFVAFLFNELHMKEQPQSLLKWRIDTLCTVLQLDKSRLIKAAIALLTLQTCWAIEDSDNWSQMLQTVYWLIALQDKA